MSIQKEVKNWKQCLSDSQKLRQFRQVPTTQSITISCDSNSSLIANVIKGNHNGPRNTYVAKNYFAKQKTPPKLSLRKRPAQMAKDILNECPHEYLTAVCLVMVGQMTIFCQRFDWETCVKALRDATSRDEKVIAVVTSVARAVNSGAVVPSEMRTFLSKVRKFCCTDYLIKIQELFAQFVLQYEESEVSTDTNNNLDAPSAALPNAAAPTVLPDAHSAALPNAAAPIVLPTQKLLDIDLNILFQNKAGCRNVFNALVTSPRDWNEVHYVSLVIVSGGEATSVELMHSLQLETLLETNVEQVWHEIWAQSQYLEMDKKKRDETARFVYGVVTAIIHHRNLIPQ